MILLLAPVRPRTLKLAQFTFKRLWGIKGVLLWSGVKKKKKSTCVSLFRLCPKEMLHTGTSSSLMALKATEWLITLDQSKRMSHLRSGRFLHPNNSPASLSLSWVCCFSIFINTFFISHKSSVIPCFAFALESSGFLIQSLKKTFTNKTLFNEMILTRVSWFSHISHVVF